MKKTYIAPGFVPEDVLTEMFLAASPTVNSNGGDVDVTYGGVDEEGTKDPDVKIESFFDFFWE